MSAANRSESSLVAHVDQPLISLMTEEDGHEVIRYFTTETEADAARASTDVRCLAGAWDDLEWEEIIDDLDQIRHASDPTPPIDDL
ncbi:MAG TPA: hypothetical protein VFL82_14240 [Thermomicrobiales bacterium]|jgi:hypothetical protein|nr:hypothetical protein [Thermomicrobiales bacterium]